MTIYDYNFPSNDFYYRIKEGLFGAILSIQFVPNFGQICFLIHELKTFSPRWQNALHHPMNWIEYAA